MATKAAAHKRPKRSTPGHPLGGLPPLPKLPGKLPSTAPNIWAILTSDGAAGILTLPKGQIPQHLSNGAAVIYATKVGDVNHQRAAIQRFNKWALRHAAFLRGGDPAIHGISTIFKRGITTGGALAHSHDEASGDPIPGIIFVTAVTAGAASAVGIPGAILGGEAGGAAAGAEAGAAGGAAAGAEGAAGGAAGGGGAAKLAGKAAAVAGTGAIAGLFTNVGWWKGLGMIVIGVVLGVLAIREFSP